MINVIRKAAALGPRGWVDLAALSALAVFVEIGVRVRPVPSIARALGLRVTGDPPSGTGRPMTSRERRRRRIVEMMSRHWPLVDRDGLCLRRSLLFGWILRARDPVLRIGVAKVDGVVSAHAWLELEGGHIGADGTHVALPMPPVKGRRRGHGSRG